MLIDYLLFVLRPGDRKEPFGGQMLGQLSWRHSMPRELKPLL